MAQKNKKTSFGVESKKYKSEEIRDARKWFKEEFKSLGDKPGGTTSDLRQRNGQIDIGKMAFFVYDPKHKKTLDYYDRYPLIIVIDIYKDGWLGINLHYLPPALRATLLGRLMEVINNVKFDQTTKLKLSYQILNAASKYKYFRPCIHRYLSNHVKSKINIIRPKKWPHAILLPSAKFVGASSKAVWRDSRSQY